MTYPHYRIITVVVQSALFFILLTLLFVAVPLLPARAAWCTLVLTVLGFGLFFPPWRLRTWCWPAPWADGHLIQFLAGLETQPRYRRDVVEEAANRFRQIAAGERGSLMAARLCTYFSATGARQLVPRTYYVEIALAVGLVSPANRLMHEFVHHCEAIRRWRNSFYRLDLFCSELSPKFPTRRKRAIERAVARNARPRGRLARAGMWVNDCSNPAVSVILPAALLVLLLGALVVGLRMLWR